MKDSQVLMCMFQSFTNRFPVELFHAFLVYCSLSSLFVACESNHTSHDLYDASHSRDERDSLSTVDLWFEQTDQFLAYDQWFADLNTTLSDQFVSSDLSTKSQLQTILDQYDQQEINVEQLTARIQDLYLPTHIIDQDIQVLADAGLNEITLLHGSHQFHTDLVVQAQGILMIAPGSEILLAPQSTLHIQGRLLVLGTSTHPIRIQGVAQTNSSDSHSSHDTENQPKMESVGYHEVLINPSFSPTQLQNHSSMIRYTGLSVAHRLIHVKNSGPHSILIQHNQLDQWSDKAIAFHQSDRLEIRHNQFAMHSDDFDGLGEAIRGFSSAAHIDANLFGRMKGYRDAIDLEECQVPHIPWVTHNRFLGGQDDGIDLDGCSAYVINNHLSHFYPPTDRPASGGVNGGGITGDRDAAPVLIGNVIDQCYHAIGFKDGAAPVLINNTITRSHIGLTLYRSRADRAQPQAQVINTLWADNLTDIQLNGAWWPFYHAYPIDPNRLQVSASCFQTQEDFIPTALGDDNFLQSVMITWHDDLPWSDHEQLHALAITEQWDTLSPLLVDLRHTMENTSQSTGLYLDLWSQDLLYSPCGPQLYVGALQTIP